MARPCETCRHPDRDAIESALVSGEPLRPLAGRVGVSKSSLARHRLACMPTTLIERAHTLEVERRQKLFEEAQTCADSLWAAVETPARWRELVAEASDDYDRGRWLLDRLGAERHLSPQEAATLLGLRNRIIAEAGGVSALEAMLVDVAILHYHNLARVQGWIGNLALLAEAHAFGLQGPGAKIDWERPRATPKFWAEEHFARIREDLLPLVERSSRAFVATVEALARLRRGPAFAVQIARAEQVNVARQQQVNTSPRPTPAAEVSVGGVSS